MAWQRLITTGFEERYPGELTLLRGGHNEFIPLNDLPSEAYTDDSAYEQFGNAGLLGISNFGIWNQLRCGYYVNPGDPFTNEDVIVGVGGLDLALPDAPGYVVTYTLDGWTFDFRHYGDASLQSISLSFVPGFNVGDWCHVGFIAKAGEDGYFSFYVNGILAIHYEFDNLEDLRFIYLPGVTGLSGVLSNIFVDSLYIDGSNDDEPDIVPPSPVYHRVYPHAQGSVDQWQLSNYDSKLDAVSTNARSFNDIPVLTADTNNQEQTFRFNSVVDYEESVVSAIILRAKALAGVASNLEFVARDEAANSTISSGVSLQQSFKMLEHRFPLRPDGSPWTHDLSDMEFGIKVDGVIGTSYVPDPDWTTHTIVTGESDTDLEALDMYYPGTGSSIPPSIISGINVMGGVIIPEVVSVLLPSSYTSMRIGYWWMHTHTSNAFLLDFEDNGNDHQWSIRMDGNQLLIYSTYEGSTRINEVFVPQTGFQQFREWKHLGFAIGSSYISLYLNGIQIFTETPGGAIVPTRISALAEGGAVRLYLDDFYVDVSNEIKADVAPPIRRFVPFDVVYPGTDQEWHNRLATGLTYPFSNGNTETDKYLEAAAAGLANLYATSSYTIHPGFEPIGLGLYAYANKGALDINGVLELSSVELDLPFNPVGSPDTGWWYYGVYSDLDPNGDPWDLDKISNAQIGVKSV